MTVARASVSGIAYWRRAGAGMRVLCLHGIGSNADSFLPLLPVLPATWDIVAWDAPGYGGSLPLANDWPRAAAYADVAAELLDGLGWDRAHVVGHSLGTLVAGGLAADHPDRVASLVLAAPACGKGQTDRVLDESSARRIADLEKLGPVAFARSRAPRLLADPANAQALDRVERAMAAVRMPGYAQAVRMLARGALEQSLTQVKVPATVIWGTADVVTPRDQADRAAAALGVPVVDIPGAGHALHAEAPEAFGAAIAAALTATEARTG